MRQHEIEKAPMVYKSLHGLAPEYLCSRFAIRETAYNFRDSEKILCIPLPRTNYYKNSFNLARGVARIFSEVRTILQIALHWLRCKPKG